MLTPIRQRFAPPVFEGNEDKTRVARLLNAVLLSFLAVVLMYGIFTPLLPNPLPALLLVSAVLAVGVGALTLLRRGRVKDAGFLFSFVVWALLTTVAVFFGGWDNPAIFGYIVVVVIAGLVMGRWGAVLFAVLSIAAGLGLAWAQGQHLLPPSLGANPPLVRWAAFALYVGMVTALLQIAMRSLDEALNDARWNAAELAQQREQLEDTVAERTQALERRTRYLEATAQVSREAAAMLDLDKLLSQAATLISERFGFYHTGLFLLDPTREWAELQAASSEGGRRMLARKHRLRVGQQGIVGYVTARGEPRIALDVGMDAVYFDNPDLPETRSEMALPLRVRGEVIGALDVQSTRAEAFTDEDAAVLQTLADQLAVAISNARLFQQAQDSLEAQRRAYGELSHQAWRGLIQTQSGLGFLRNRQGLAPAGDVWRPEMEEAVRSGQIASSGDAPGSLAIPVRVGTQTVGVVNARKGEGAGGWRVEETALLQALSEQLGVALESARLYEDTQRRAAEEQLTGEIAARMRETLDVDSVLQTAIREMGTTLGIHRIELRMGAGTARLPGEGEPKRGNNHG